MVTLFFFFLLFVASSYGEKCYELNLTHFWSKGYTGLINLQTDQLTTSWNLSITFSDGIESFKTWKGDIIEDGNSYNITNKCYNGILYTSQCLAIDYIVRHGYKDPPTVTQITFNDQILDTCTQALTCEVANSSETTACDSCSKCPSPGVEGGYETYDHATEQFTQLWGNVSSLNQLVSVNLTELETKVATLMGEIATLKTRVGELETPLVFNCAFMSGDIITSTTTGLSPYTCDINEAIAVDASSGIFTVPKAGKYRLTFMALNVPLMQKKVVCILTKSSSGVETKIARSVAQTKLGDLEEQITTTIDIIHEFLQGDTVQVDISVTKGAKIVGTDSTKPQQVTFTGQFIRS